MTPDDEPGFVSLETMDAIFGPGWRTPYCLWPRGRSAEVDQGPVVQGSETTFNTPAPYSHKPAKPETRQLRLGDTEPNARQTALDLAHEINRAMRKKDAA